MNKSYCPRCCKEINLSDLLVGIGGCVYCPENESFTGKIVKDEMKGGLIKNEQLDNRR